MHKVDKYGQTKILSRLDASQCVTDTYLIDPKRMSTAEISPISLIALETLSLYYRQGTIHILDKQVQTRFPSQSFKWTPAHDWYLIDRHPLKYTCTESELRTELQMKYH